MQRQSNIIQLVQHMSWADSKLWQSVLKTDTAEFDKKIKELLYHIHIVQHVYYQVWSGKPIVVPDLLEFPNLINIVRWGHETNVKIYNLVAIMDEIELGLTMKNSWREKIKKEIGQMPSDATVEESILQVVSHSTYHRAQVNSRIRELKGEPAKIDFIIWVWLGKPGNEWSNLSVFKK
jgi:uncharacterized damage-inducible protein DinB